MPYGESFDFSYVTLPGVGGQINASNAMTTDQLARKNKSGLKWGPNKDGGMSHHREAQLESNKLARSRRDNLINRNYADCASGSDAMKEIMGRRKARAEQFRSLKKKEYNFGDDSEVLSMPQPFASSECASCKTRSCGCASCKTKKNDFREWSSEDRQDLKEGKVKGEFAGPNMSFPISSPQDVAAAWSSVGRASNPRELMTKIIKIAKRYGWESGLPETVKKRLGKGQSGLPE
jgi:hypothetical protein